MVNEVRQTIAYAQRIAAYYNEDQLSSVHILLASLGSVNERIVKAYNKHGVKLERVLSIYLPVEEQGFLPIPEVLDVTEELKPILSRLSEGTAIYQFLANIVREATDAQILLSSIDVDTTKLVQDLVTIPVPIKVKNKTPNMDKYCKDLSKKAADGELDPVIGRKKEIARLVRVLGRRRKNNPVILGPAGVGKSAVVEGLALSIHNEEKHCQQLHGKKLVVLDLSRMLAGTKYRGMFEERLTGVVEELEADPNVIAFVDEVHMVVGSGDSEGGQDAANILKPAMARGKIQIIGATTIKEFNVIKRDAALARRFQPVVLEPLTKKEIAAILRGIKKLYEEHHEVRYTNKALDKILELASQIEGRHAPDVQIDLMDEAGSAAIRKKVCAEDIERVYALQQEANQSKKKTLGFGA
jgi:ATP-dependent Clp protease ATP-binding subunit ClpC